MGLRDGCFVFPLVTGQEEVIKPSRVIKIECKMKMRTFANAYRRASGGVVGSDDGRDDRL